MRQTKLLFLLMLLCASLTVSCAKKYKVVVMETNLGTIKLKLYEDTPLHSENFLKLAGEGHFDGLLFHRVIKDFMIQGGASDSKGAEKGKMVGLSDPGYSIDAEFRPGHFHKKGALAAAREGDEVNPEKKSSGEQFYIVQGKTFTDDELNMIEKRRLVMAKNDLGRKLFQPKLEEYRQYLSSGQQDKADSLIQSINAQIEKEFADYKDHLIPAEVREIYKTTGGTPHLDGAYTVFGEVIEGLEIVVKIAAVKTDSNDRPEEDVMILKTTLKKK